MFVVDGSESELGILDLIQVSGAMSWRDHVPKIRRLVLLTPLSLLQVFVESLDRAFENVCELDLVFHFDEVSPERKGRVNLNY